MERLIAFSITSSYVVSKFGVMGLYQGMCVEGADFGVNVRSITARKAVVTEIRKRMENHNNG